MTGVCVYVCPSPHPQEVRHLKDLPKLIICDFSGNAMCATTNYRLFVIYFLRRLKVCPLAAVDVRVFDVKVVRRCWTAWLWMPRSSRARRRCTLAG